MEEIVGDVKAAYPQLRLGVHCHNDQGLAVANSLQAVRSGADLVQVGTEGTQSTSIPRAIPRAIPPSSHCIQAISHVS